MEIALTKRSYPLLHLFKSWYNANTITSRNKSFTIELNKTVELEHRIYGEITGNAPLIILHDLLSRKEDWERITNQIRNCQNYERTVINVDLRNHGQSPHAPSHGYLDMAADIKSLMEKHKIKEAILMGHGMGARTAMALALAEPSKVSNLIVVDSSPISTSESYHDFYPRLLGFMKSIKFDRVTDIKMAKRLVYYKFQDWDIDLDFGTEVFILNNVGQKEGQLGWISNVDTLKKDFKKLQTFPFELAGKCFEGPSFFIGGAESDFIPTDDCEVIKEMFPLSDIRYILEAGHNLQKDNPDCFLALVNIFLSYYNT